MKISTSPRVPALHGRWCAAIKQFSGFHAIIKFLEADGAVGCGALHEVGRAQIMGMGEASRGDQVGERLDGFAVEAGHAFSLVGNDYGALAGRILG